MNDTTLTHPSLAALRQNNPWLWWWAWGGSGKGSVDITLLTEDMDVLPVHLLALTSHSATSFFSSLYGKWQTFPLQSYTFSFISHKKATSCNLQLLIFAAEGRRLCAQHYFNVFKKNFMNTFGRFGGSLLRQHWPTCCPLISKMIKNSVVELFYVVTWHPRIIPPPPELHQTQPVSAQSICAHTEWGNRKKLLVDAEPRGGKEWEVASAQSCLYGQQQ